MPDLGSERRGVLGEAVLLAAGLADVLVDGLGGVVARGRAVLGRSDVAELADQGHREVLARGRVVLGRFAVEPAYLEIVARHVGARGDRAGG
ncbi:polyprenyl synthetase [Kitasatospora sp. HPMI-4]|uniref:polyprenyl synthetase n=1 Tax=Kitasatospora sp. HPMI-4 TaxID=3448443 RepID=UPI003F1D30DF